MEKSKFWLERRASTSVLHFKDGTEVLFVHGTAKAARCNGKCYKAAGLKRYNHQAVLNWLGPNFDTASERPQEWFDMLY